MVQAHDRIQGFPHYGISSWRNLCCFCTTTGLLPCFSDFACYVIVNNCKMLRKRNLTHRVYKTLSTNCVRFTLTLTLTRGIILAFLECTHQNTHLDLWGILLWHRRLPQCLELITIKRMHSRYFRWPTALYETICWTHSVVQERHRSGWNFFLMGRPPFGIQKLREID